MSEHGPFNPESRDPRRHPSEPGGGAFSSSPSSPAASCPPLLDLAAYIDGRPRMHAGDTDDAARIELHLTRCPVCLDAVREVLAIRAEQSEREPAMTFVPSHVLEAAMRLVPAQTEVRINLQATEEDGGGSYATRAAQRRFALWITFSRRSAAAAAAIAIGVLGHHVGASLSTPVESADESAIAVNATFGLVDDAADDSAGAELLQAALERGGEDTP